MSKSNPLLGQIEQYVPPDGSAPPLGTPAVEPVIKIGNSKTDGIYTASTLPVTHEDRTRMEKRIQTVIEEHEQDTMSLISRVIGIIIALTAILIGLYIVSAVFSQMPQITSTKWLP